MSESLHVHNEPGEWHHNTYFHRGIYLSTYFISLICFVCACVHTHLCKPEDHSISSVFLPHPPPYLLRQALSMNLELSDDWIGCPRAQGPSCVLLLPGYMPWFFIPVSFFLWELVVNLRPLYFLPSILSAKPCFWPQMLVLMMLDSED